MTVLWILSLWPVLALLTGLFLWRMFSAQRTRDRQALAAGPAADDAGATEFPVRGTSTRAGFLQGMHSKNSINPRFWVEHDAVRIRILGNWHLPFADIRHVDARKTMTGTALIFRIDAASRTFIVRFDEAALARSALLLLPSTVPLAEGAAMLRDGDARAATPGLPRYRGPLG